MIVRVKEGRENEVSQTCSAVIPFLKAYKREKGKVGSEMRMCI